MTFAVRTFITSSVFCFKNIFVLLLVPFVEMNTLFVHSSSLDLRFKFVLFSQCEQFKIRSAKSKAQCLYSSGPNSSKNQNEMKKLIRYFEQTNVNSNELYDFF